MDLPTLFRELGPKVRQFLDTPWFATTYSSYLLKHFVLGSGFVVSVNGCNLNVQRDTSRYEILAWNLVKCRYSRSIDWNV